MPLLTELSRPLSRVWNIPPKAAFVAVSDDAGQVFVTELSRPLSRVWNIPPKAAFVVGSDDAGHVFVLPLLTRTGLSYQPESAPANAPQGSSCLVAADVRRLKSLGK